MVKHTLITILILTNREMLGVDSLGIYSLGCHCSGNEFARTAQDKLDVSLQIFQRLFCRPTGITLLVLSAGVNGGCNQQEQRYQKNANLDAELAWWQTLGSG